MDEGNNTETTGKLLGGVTGKGFMPGVSGNPSGRPKNTLKDYLRQKFNNMTDEEKEAWLITHDVPADVQWKMAEGNPANATDITSQGKPIIQLTPEIAAKNAITPSPESDS